MSTTWGPTDVTVDGSDYAGSWDAGDAWIVGNLGGVLLHGGASFQYTGSTIKKADTINHVYVHGHAGSAMTMNFALRLQSGNWAAFSSSNHPHDATWANARAASETTFSFNEACFGPGETRELDLAADLATAIDADAGDQLENGDYINICLFSAEATSGDYMSFSQGVVETLTIEWTAAAGGGATTAPMMMHFARLRRR